MSHEEHGKKPGLQIFINKTPFKAPKEEMTGLDLKTLGGIPQGNKLFREESGSHPDTPVGAAWRGRARMILGSVEEQLRRLRVAQLEETIRTVRTVLLSERQ